VEQHHTGASEGATATPKEWVEAIEAADSAAAQAENDAQRYRDETQAAIEGHVQQQQVYVHLLVILVGVQQPEDETK
jgi:transcription elongation GreA/GreB family factor